MNYTLQSCTSLETVAADEWNALLPDHNPFLSYAFLHGLEQHGCLGTHVGWQPLHFLLSNDSGKLCGAAPCYLKNNSFGEFVFDWAWASAYERQGLHYYPKLVCAVPFTPAGGARLLCGTAGGNDDNPGQRRQALLTGMQSFAAQQDLSSIHCLFVDDDGHNALTAAGWLPRLQFQYHWHNRGYSDFEHYLSFFRSRRRKTVRAERRSVSDAGITTRIVHGDDIDDELWPLLYGYYRSTFFNKGNYPALTESFFRHLGSSLGRQLVVVLAEKQGEPVAAAINLRSDTHLYGRYWGSNEHYHNLHFEVCFYAGIEYCIEHGLQVYEPGAQGEHKISRGFLPQQTWSAHWIADATFRRAIADFLQREQLALQEHRPQLEQLSPFRDNDDS